MQMIRLVVKTWSTVFCCVCQVCALNLSIAACLVSVMALKSATGQKAKTVVRIVMLKTESWVLRNIMWSGDNASQNVRAEPSRGLDIYKVNAFSQLR